jgi:hypothetical protein
VYAASVERNMIVAEIGLLLNTIVSFLVVLPIISIKGLARDERDMEGVRKLVCLLF